MASVNDFGIKVSQVGYNVETTADFQLLFSSSWPLLKIHAQGSFTIPNNTVDTTIYTHNLGYYPAFLAFDNKPNSSGILSGASSLASDGIVGGQLGVNKTELKFFSNGFGDGSSNTIYYYIYRTDLESIFTAPSMNITPSTQTINRDYGIKVSVPGKGITSTDLRDYTVHSGTLSPLIHQVATGLSDTTPHILAKHNLGYQTVFLTYTRAPSGVGANYYIQLGGAHQAVPASFADINSVYIDMTGLVGWHGSIIVLKDPFSLANPTTSVSF